VAVQYVVTNVIKESESTGNEETESLESSVRGSVKTEEKLYTPKEVFLICLTIGIAMGILSLFYVMSAGPTTDAKIEALNSMCWTYGNTTGGAVKVIDGSGSFTVICEPSYVVEESWKVSIE
jgi:hypothetical protein